MDGDWYAQLVSVKPQTYKNLVRISLLGGFSLWAAVMCSSTVMWHLPGAGRYIESFHFYLLARHETADSISRKRLMSISRAVRMKSKTYSFMSNTAPAVEPAL